eukprot:s2165_g3.t1
MASATALCKRSMFAPALFLQNHHPLQFVGDSLEEEHAPPPRRIRGKRSSGERLDDVFAVDPPPPLPPPAKAPHPEGPVPQVEEESARVARLSLQDLEGLAKELIEDDWDLDEALWVLAEALNAFWDFSASAKPNAQPLIPDEILEELGCTVYNPNTDNKELYKEESDSRWLLTFQENLDIIEESKRGFVLQIQQGQVREKSYMQISEEKMGKKWNVPRIGLYAFPVTAFRGGGGLVEEYLATAVEKARAQWEEGVKDEVQMVSEWFEPIGGDLELPVNGEGKDARRHGTGTFTHASGEVYVGEYEDGKKNGKGTYTYADGAVYVGEFNDNKRNGKGTYTYKSGNVEVGFYEQDKDKGRSVQLSADSKTAWLVMDGKVEREVSVAEARKVVAYNALLASLAEGQQWQLTLGALEEMHCLGIGVDEVSVTSALGACEKGQQWETALLLLFGMPKRALR